MKRLGRAFAAARSADRAAFIAYVTAGDPHLDRTPEIATALRRAGVDILELGVPFSDPIADGPTNQRAAERALEAGTTLTGVLDCVARIRRTEELPIVLFTYSNPVFRYGVERFADDASSVGVDGVLLTDVPVEELDRFGPMFASRGLAPVLLVTPTSTRSRVKVAAKRGRGFLYLVSRTGVTGARQSLESDLERQVAAARKLSKLPVAVGFGISNPSQVAAVARIADGVVVGSAIVDQVARVADADALADTVQRFVTPLVEACQR